MFYFFPFESQSEISFAWFQKHATTNIFCFERKLLGDTRSRFSWPDTTPFCAFTEQTAFFFSLKRRCPLGDRTTLFLHHQSYIIVCSTTALNQLTMPYFNQNRNSCFLGEWNIELTRSSSWKHTHQIKYFATSGKIKRLHEFLEKYEIRALEARALCYRIRKLKIIMIQDIRFNKVDDSRVGGEITFEDE